MNDLVRVSVVMNTFNEAPKYLQRAIESYLRQTRIDIQLIVSTIDDDPNLELIKSYPKVEVVLTERSKHPGKSPEGSYLQITNALPYCNGKYFCFASSNDWAERGKLYTESQCLESSGAKICYSAYNLCRHLTGAIIDVVYFQNYEYEAQRRSNYVSDCAMIEMELLRQYMPFRTVGNFAFWDLWLRIAKDSNRGDRNTVFYYYSRPTWNYRKSPDSMSRQRLTTIEGKMEYQLQKERFIKTYHP